MTQIEPSSPTILKMKKLYDSFTRAEKRVLDCVIASPADVIYASVAELALRCRVSEPTVVRACKKLGCIVTFRHDQFSGGKPLFHNKPGTSVTRAAAQANALALTDGVEDQTVVTAQHFAVDIDDIARLACKVLGEEFGEIPLADEADAGGILALCIG